MVLNTNSGGIYRVWYRFIFPYTHSFQHQLFFLFLCLYFSPCPFLPSPLHLSFLVFFFPPLKSFFLSFFLACSLFEFFSFSECSGWKVSAVRMKSTSLLLCVCVCVRARQLCVCAHAWASRAVKVRLIHWLQLRGVERSAEFNFYQFGPLPLRMPTGWPSFCCGRLLASHREEWRVWPGFNPNSLSLFYQANFGHVSNPSRRADWLACFQIIAPLLQWDGEVGWISFLVAASWTLWTSSSICTWLCL